MQSQVETGSATIERPEIPDQDLAHQEVIVLMVVSGTRGLSNLADQRDALRKVALHGAGVFLGGPPPTRRPPTDKGPRFRGVLGQMQIMTASASDSGVASPLSTRGLARNTAARGSRGMRGRGLRCLTCGNSWATEAWVFRLPYRCSPWNCEGGQRARELEFC
ncbi:unnamed protein product, partial [Prorocentrum cordatum]